MNNQSLDGVGRPVEMAYGRCNAYIPVIGYEFISDTESIDACGGAICSCEGVKR